MLTLVSTSSVQVQVPDQIRFCDSLFPEITAELSGFNRTIQLG